MTKKRTSQKLPKILSRTDAKKILAIPNTKTLTGLKNRVILQVLYRTGLRVQEICNLTLADVNIKDGLIYVQQSKNNRDRYVPFDTQTAQWLLTWIKKHKGVWGKTYPSTHFFFPSNTGAKLNQSHPPHSL